MVEGEGADGGLEGRAVVMSWGDDRLWGGEGGGFPGRGRRTGECGVDHCVTPSVFDVTDTAD